MPSAFFTGATNTTSPGFRSERSPATYVMIPAVGGTNTVVAPSLCPIASSRPAAAVTAPVTVPLVILLPGSRSQSRCPSPAPRIASGKIRISIAVILPSAPVRVVVPT